jgi:hypothetical protein
MKWSLLWWRLPWLVSRKSRIGGWPYLPIENNLGDGLNIYYITDRHFINKLLNFSSFLVMQWSLHDKRRPLNNFAYQALHFRCPLSETAFSACAFATAAPFKAGKQSG